MRELFLQSVKFHLRSDVPVGAALSGRHRFVVDRRGHAAARAEAWNCTPSATSPTRTELSEEKWVDSPPSRPGPCCTRYTPQPGELVDNLEQLVYQQDEPFGSTSIYAQHLVFRLARESGITVMLDGQGADEMLGGYRAYLAARLASLVRQGHWIRAAKFLKHIRRLPGTGGLGADSAADHRQPGSRPAASCSANNFCKRTSCRAGSTRPGSGRHGIRPHETNKRPRSADLLRQQLHRTLVETSLPMLLRYEDRNSMAHSIESRVPFLIPSLAEFLLRLPEEYLIGPDGTSKRIFRDATRGFVPDAILDRKDKIGFATPEQRWLTALRPWAEKILHSDTARSIPAFRCAGACTRNGGR